MGIFESTIALLALALVLAAFARRIGAPYPVFLALMGVGLALASDRPPLEANPDLTLALFVAPILMDAGYHLSARDLKRNWPQILGLVVGAVAATTLAVAVVARWLEPSLSFAAAIALGAIVAPPDAIAASAVLKYVRPPQRLVTILEGESLFNDASALMIYRAAILAAVSHNLTPAYGLELSGAVVMSVVAGAALGWLSMRLFRHIEDASTAILYQFISVFAVWIGADHLKLSAVLTVIAYAMVTARLSSFTGLAHLRISSKVVWAVVIFFLNVMAFVLIGLQIGPILTKLEASQRLAYFEIALGVLATVIVVRFIWVFAFSAVWTWLARLRGAGAEASAYDATWKSKLIVSWCGMRGIVTIASALGLPPGAFPQRDLIIFCAFVTVIGTLVLQGLTLRPLVNAMKLPQDQALQREVGYARTEAIRAAFSALETDDSDAARRVRAEYGGLLQIADSDPDAYAPYLSEEDHLRLRAMNAARRKILEMRASFEIGDDAFHIVEHELDRAEALAEDI